MWLENIKENKSSLYYWGYLASIGVIFYIMNYYTPLSADDFRYAFMFGANRRIESISDIVTSQYYHYLEMNGRTIPHILIQLFIGIIGKSTYNFINTLIFITFIHTITIITAKSKKNYIKHAILLSFVIFFFFPAFSECFLWISGSINNLWSATFILIFHYFIIHKNIQFNLLYPISLVIGILVGWTHEGITLGLLGGYLILFFLFPKKLTKHRIYSIIGLLIGILLLIFSPAAINRALSHNSNINICIQILNTIYYLFNLKVIFLVLILLAFIYCKNIKINKKILAFHFTNIAISLLFIIVIARTTYERSYFGIELYSLILFSYLFRYIITNIRPRIYIILYLILIFISIPIIKTQYSNYRDWNKVIIQLQKTKSNIIYTNEVNCNKYIERFILRYLIPESNEFYNSFIYENNNENLRLTRYYNRNNIQFIPQRFVKMVTSDPNKFTHFFNNKNLPFYVMEVEADINIDKVYLLMKKISENEIPFYLRPFAHKLARFTLLELETKKYSTININNKRYLLIGKNKILDRRIKNVKIYDNNSNAL